MLISLLHRTTFVYAGKAHDSFNEVRLRPVDDAGQLCRSFELRTEPVAQMRDYVDFYGNTVHYFDIAAGHDRLMIEAVSEVETTPNAARPPVPAVPNLPEGGERELVAEFLAGSHYVPLEAAVWREAQDALADGRRDVWSDVRHICRHVFKNFAYKPRSTGVATLATDAISLRSGVCQDFAHVALVVIRSMGIPARYVSGYLHSQQGAEIGERVEGQSHAWIEAWTGDWWGFDPTNHQEIGHRHVGVARGRDYADVAPLRGVHSGGGQATLEVEVNLTRLR